MPWEATGSPTLVALWDCSDIAYAAVVYAVWRGEGGETVDVRIIASKVKVSKDWDKSTPRQELQGAVLASRLTAKIVESIHAKPKKVWFIGDSETVLASREKWSGFFTEWFSNRIGETHDNQKRVEDHCKVGNNGEWWHIKGSLNPADQPTRLNSKPEDIAYGSA